MKRLVLLLTVLTAIQSSAVAQYARWIVEPVYDQIEEFNGTLAAVKRGGKWGYINQDGEEIIACEYDRLTPFVEGVAIATAADNQLKAIIHEDGSIIDNFRTQNGGQIILTVDPRYPYFGSGMLMVTNGVQSSIKDAKYTMWGYVDKRGVLQIPIKYLSAMPFCEGKAGVADTSMKFSYIDNTGKTVIPDNMNGGRTTGAFGFYNGKALVAEKKKFIYIDESGRKISEETGAEPNERYCDTNKNLLNCGDSNALIDSLGRLNRVIYSNGFVLNIVEREPEKIALKGDTHFTLDGEKVNESAKWITTSLAVLPSAGKLGIIKVQDSPVVNLTLPSKSVHAIFGNIEPVPFSLVNDTNVDINDLEIVCNGDVVENRSIPTTNLDLTFPLTKPTDAEVEVVKESFKVTQRGVLLMDEIVDIIIVDEPAINIIGRNDLVFFQESNTASLSVDVQNTSKYPLEDAVLTMNNYQTRISVEPNSTINCPTFFGVNPDDAEISISISIKHAKAQAVTKQGTMLIDGLTDGSGGEQK